VYFYFFLVFECFGHIPGHTVFASHFPHFLSFFSPQSMCNFYISRFSLFLAIYQVLECVFLIYTFYIVSCNIPGHTVFASHFLHFFSFLASIQVLQCVFLIFHVYQCFLAIFLVLQCLFLILHDFHCFFTIFHFLPCESLIFHIFQFSLHTPGPTVCISHFPPFSLVFVLFYVIQRLSLIFHDFQFSRHTPGPTVSIYIPGPTVFASHFPRFSVFSPGLKVCICKVSRFSGFLNIFHVQHCVFLIFHDVQISRHTPGPTVCISHFPSF